MRGCNFSSVRILPLTIIALLSVSCSDGRDVGDAHPANNPVPNSKASLLPGKTPPSAQAIIAAGDCEPPPCDDVGACARMPIVEVRDLQCRTGAAGDTADCSFVMVPDIGSGEYRLRQTARVVYSLKRRSGDAWCIAS